MAKVCCVLACPTADFKDLTPVRHNFFEYRQDRRLITVTSRCKAFHMNGIRVMLLFDQ